MSSRGSSSSSKSPTVAGPSATATAAASSSNDLQPFQCLVCGSRFTRYENLKRHSLLHRASKDETKFPCFHCVKVFARRDLRKRHIKKQHPTAGTKSPGPQAPPETQTEPPLVVDTRPQSQSAQSEEFPNIPQSSISSSGNSTADLSFLLGPSDGDDPFGASSSFNPTLGRTATPSAFSIDSLLSSHLSAERHSLGSGKGVDHGMGDATDTFMPTFDPPDNMSQTSRQSISVQPSLASPNIPDMNIPQSTMYAGVQVYFRHISPYLPFIHQPTFDLQQAPEPLIMGMLSISMQFWSDPEEGARMSTYCFHRGRRLLSDVETSEEPFSALDLSTIQAYILLEIHALLYAGGSATTYGLRMHAKSIELARRGGLTEPYPTVSTDAGDLEALWRQFIRGESHKRTLFAAQMLDVFWYHILSLPRILSHLEIKHDLPCSEEMWAVSSATEWAHRALINAPAKSSVRYLAAVRAVLAPNPSLNLATFDPYGSLMIILFLSSSVREVSGWSTMTGRVSFERFEALHSSLTVFEPLIQSCSDDNPMAVMMKATWHMAMIELLLWSPSHTNGVVEGSLDAALAAATHLSVSQALLSSPQVVASLDPHVNWYLSYLDRQTDLFKEPPWVTIFAFKASLTAWQLVRAGVVESTMFLGISDTKGMYDWIHKVFERRTSWAIGRLVVKSLKELDVVM